MELTTPRKIYLLLSVLAVVAIFFLLSFKLYDNIDDDYSYELNSDGETVTVTGHSGENGKLDIPSEIDGHKVTAIAKSAFANKSHLKKLSIPGSVEVIGEYAFDNCTSLQTVKLEEGTKIIGHYAFYGCKNMSRFDMPDTVEEIGDFAFYSCTNLKKLRIPAACAEIGADAFAACESLMLDCRDNPAAAEIAAIYTIPTEFKETENYIVIKIVAMTVILGVIVAAAIIVLPKIIKRKQKNQKVEK